MFKTLMIVERDQDLATAASEATGGGAWRLSAFNDPFQALSRAASKAPDVVAVATRVGPMTGYEFVHRLRQVPGAFEIPAIIAGADVDERLASGLAGTTLITLPAHPGDFRAMLDKMVPEDGGSEFHKEFEDVFGGIFEEGIEEKAAPEGKPPAGEISMPGFMPTGGWEAGGKETSGETAEPESAEESDIETFDFSQEEAAKIETTQYWEAPEASIPQATALESEPLEIVEIAEPETAELTETPTDMQTGLEIVEEIPEEEAAIFDFSEEAVEAPSEEPAGEPPTETHADAPQKSAEEDFVDELLDLELTEVAAKEANALLHEFLKDEEEGADKEAQGDDSGEPEGDTSIKPSAEPVEEVSEAVEEAAPALEADEVPELLEVLEPGPNGAATGYDVLEAPDEFGREELVADLTAPANDTSPPDETSCVLNEGVPEEADNLVEIPLPVCGEESFDVAVEEAGLIPDAGPEAVPDLSGAVLAAVESALKKALSPEAVGVIVAREIERIIWEVVPPLAEKLITEAIEKTMNPPPEDGPEG